MDRPVLTIVDDDPGMSSLLKDVGEDLGFQVSSYNDGTRFLEEFNDQMGVIVLDLMMPTVDGIEVMRFLSDRHCKNPLILISGYEASVLNAAQKLAQERQLSVVAGFSKPLPMKKLQALLKTLQDELPVEEQVASVSAEIGLHDLQRAIEQNQLELHYQPQVDFNSGSLIGAEALVRWRHPEYGLIYPGRFVPLAEQHGLIGDLTAFVIQHAVKQSGAWQESGCPLRLSVNVSAEDISSLQMPEQLRSLVNENCLDASLLTLEVTESALMGQLVNSLDILTRLRMKGFELSIDDFGTGYSSLSQLHRVPFTELKIDLSFVGAMDADDEACAIVETCIMLGHKLNMKVVAEGVENKKTWDMLQQMGCDIAQGYYIARPMPAETLSEWVEQGCRTGTQ